MRLRRALVGTGVAAICACSGSDRGWIDPGVRAQEAATVFLKIDFDAGANPFSAAGNAEAVLVDGAAALSGRSLQIRRTAPGGYFGAGTPLKASGATGLRIAFVVRAANMYAVTVNAFDERRQDNTTPASPARTADEAWRPIVLAVEDFHYNSSGPEGKVAPAIDLSGLLFHGRQTGPAATVWIDKVVVYRGPDDSPPQAPGGLRAAANPDGSISLTWEEPLDNTFAVVYSVHRRAGAGPWEKIAESLQPAYRDRPPSSATIAYRVTAADYDNNVSSPSAEATVSPSAPAAIEPGAAPPPWIADRAGYAAHIRAVRARRAGKVRRDVFLFAGDSITAATRYTHILGSWLGRGLTVRQGVGTVTTDYGAAHIEQYLSSARPEFAIVMYGTNDVGQGASVSGSMRNLGAIVDACLEMGTIPVLATIPPRGYNARRQGDQERFNKAVAALGRQRRIPVSYVFEEMIQHDLKTVLFDGIHLMPEPGNDLAGRALRQTMDQVYFALRDAGRQ